MKKKYSFTMHKGWMRIWICMFISAYLLPLASVWADAPETDVNDNATSIVYSGSSWWVTGGRTGDYQGDVHVASATGDAFEFTFSGTGVEYITEKNTDMGNVEIFVDGVSQGIISCYASSKLTMQPVYSIAGLTNGPHTIRGVKMTGAWMLVDAFKVFNDGPFTLLQANTGSSDDITVLFNQSLDKVTSENASNYSLTGGATVQSAVLQPNRKSLKLTASGMLLGQTYMLTVMNIKNAPQTQTISTGTTLSFTHNGGMINHYPFDETVGSSVYDMLNPPAAGTVIGNVYRGIGKTGNGLTFYSASPGYADLGLSNVLGQDSYVTEAWINPTSVSNTRMIMSQDTAGANAYKWQWSVTNGQLSFSMCSDQGTGCFNITGGFINAGEWSHVVLMKNAGSFSMYVNGLYAAGTDQNILQPNNPNPVRVGAELNGTGTKFNGFEGTIDDVRLYGVALTETQIMEQFRLNADNNFNLTVSNGSLQAQFVNSLGITPVASDFRATVKVNADMKVSLPLTGFTYNSTNQTASFAFAPLQPKFVTQNVAIELAYKGLKVPAVPFVISNDVNNIAPAASSVTVSGQIKTREVLKADYTYSDADGHTEGVSTYRWLISDTATGTFVALPGVYTRTMFILPEHVGKYIKVEVTPVDSKMASGTPQLSPVYGPVTTTVGNPRVDWFKDAKYGLSHHFLQNYNYFAAANDSEKMHPGESWDDFLSTFDVQEYAKEVAETGAGFVILTMDQHSGYKLAPNAAFESIAGLAPGQRSATRDLPLEIANELSKYNIKLMLYLMGFPSASASINYYDDPINPHINRWGDYEVTRSFELPPGTDKVNQESTRKWQSVIKEWSERYGDKLAGWWFDGLYDFSYYTDMTKSYNISSFMDAVRAGNPNRIVAMAGSGKSPYTDYEMGESYDLNGVPTTRWVDGTTFQQWFKWTPLGKDVVNYGWGEKGVQRPVDDIVTWVKNATDRQGVIGLDTKINRFGQLDPDQFAQLKKVKAVVRDGMPLPLVTVNNTSSGFTYSGSGWWNSADRPTDYQSDVQVTGTNGDAFQYTFTGTGVDYITEKNIDMGQVEIFIDGVSKGNVDSYNSTKLPQQVLYSIRDLPYGSHTIQGVKKTGAWMLVDALNIVNQAQGFTNDTSTTITYSGSGWWLSDGRSGDYQSDVHAVGTNGSSFQYTFKGTGIDFITEKNVDMGQVEIFIDGVSKGIVDCYNTMKQTQQVLYSIRNLVSGFHTIKGVKKTGSWMLTDKFTIY